MAKDRYEISLWDDVFVAANGNVPGHYEEEKIAVIGSDSMTTQCRAIEPKLVCNVNGKVTFTFKMYYRYHDELTGEDYDNPFLKLLVNERKVKVLWLGEWYDLIIKNIQESSNGKTVIYTCEDANINELAKTGFNLIFDDDLSYNNVEGGNQGTVEELVGRTIAGTDWVLGTSDTIQQFTEESVYEVTVPAARSAISAYDMVASNTVSIGPGKTFLVYYPQLADIINEGTQGTVTLDQLYLAYDPTQQYDRLAKTEMLVQANCCTLGANSSAPASCDLIINGSTATFSTEHGAFGTIDVNNISSRYRANRLVREQVTKIEPVTGKYCYVYEYNEGESENQYFYKTIETEFKDATYATNLFVNGSSFTSKADGISPAGWDFPSTSLSLAIYPVPDVNQQGNSKVYVSVMGASDSQDRYFYNDALKANSYYFSNGVKKGEKYIFRIKAKEDIDDESYINPIRLEPFIGEYTVNQDNGNKNPVNPGSGGYFVVSTVAYESGWATYTLTCKTSFTASEIISKKIGLFIKQPKYNTAYTRFIEAVEFFKYIEDSDGIMMEPGKLDKVGAIKTLYTYFDITNKKKVNYLYSDTVDWGSIPGDPVYDNTYSKIRSINIKQSNRFNILQTIAETFECWIRFNVPHDINTGQLIYEDPKTHAPSATPQKFVNILKEIGEERSIGFVYGIDLQSIQRTIESNSIVTKTIVLENNNEFGKNGTCRISRSSFNYPQTDYIYNFDYYINHGLLDGDELTKDLYYNSGDETTTQGFYKNLHDWNLEYEELAQKYSDYSLALLKNQGLQTVYESTLNTSKEDVDQAKKKVCNYLGTSAYTNQSTQDKINEIMGPNGSLEKRKILQPLLETIEANTQIKKKYGDLLKELQGNPGATPPTKGSIKEYEDLIESCEDSMLELEAKIGAKTELFEKKYARFISEGSWTDSKYYDDNLYYLDANSVAYTSSRPKVSYNISVIRVTGLKDFWMKDFALGDISYIEDTEFFGYTYIQEGDRQVKTPYREKVIITEITYNFDEPNKDTFKVQNYRTQFEDLFQRIAAQTQSLQYSTGIYNKVSDIIKTDSTIKSDVLKASFDANSNVLDRTSVNNMVTTDDAGITVTNIQNASEAVRVTSGGLFITTDGGDSWKNAIRGDGIGTQYLTSGAIDTKKIQIFGETGTDESAVAFKWDADGINAYDTANITQADEVAYDPQKYVRFNKDGIVIHTSTSSASGASYYDKLQLGKLDVIRVGNKDYSKYGLRINTYENGQTVTGFEATDSGLYVRGNITATSLTLGQNVTVPASKVMIPGTDSSVAEEIAVIDSKIQTIEGSSVNLIKNAGTFTSWSSSSGISFQPSSQNGITSVVFSSAETSSWRTAYTGDSGLVIPYLAIHGKKVTFSIWVTSNEASSYAAQDGKRFAFVLRRISPTGTTVGSYVMGYVPEQGKQMTSSWTRYEWTFDVDNSIFSLESGATLSFNDVIQIRLSNTSKFQGGMQRPQLEIGGPATDWKPNDGDQELIIRSSEFVQTDQRINAAVSSISGLSSQVATLSITAGEISSRVTSVEQGSHNLLQNTQSLLDWEHSGIVQIQTSSSGGFNYANFVNVAQDTAWRTLSSMTSAKKADGTYYDPCDDPLMIPYSAIRNKTITFSFYLWSTEASSYTGTDDNRVVPAIYLYRPRREGTSRVNSRYRFFSRIPNTNFPMPSGSWSQYSVTQEITDEWLNEGSTQSGIADIKVGENDYVAFTILRHSPYQVYISRLQVEIGTITHAWAPSNGITESAIIQTADSISLKVAKDGVIASINASAESSGGSMVRINADKINITGAVTFSALNNDLKSSFKQSGGTTYIDGANIYTGTVSADAIAANAITAAKISAGAVTAAKISVTDLKAIGATIGGWTIDTTKITKTVEVSNVPYEVLLSTFIKSSDPGSSVAMGVRNNSTNDYVFKVDYDGSITATKGTIGGCTIDANGNLNVPATHITDRLTANQINGKDLVITGTGKFGAFTIGTFKVGDDAQSYSGIEGGSTKINTYSLSTNNIYSNYFKTNSANITGRLFLNNTSGVDTPYWKTINLTATTATTIAGLRDAINGIISAINGKTIYGAEQ